MTYHQQSLETFLLSQNDSHLNPGRNNTNIDRISPDAGSSKSVSRGNLNDNDDPSITSVPTRSPRNSRKSGERHGELDIGIEYNPSVPAQKRLPSKRGGADSRQKTTTTNKPRKYNDDLPPLPTQHTHSSNGGPRVQYPQGTRALYSVDTPQAHVGSLSMSSVQRNQCTMYPQIRPQTQQPRGTHVSFSANSKPRDSEYVEPPSESVPIPEKRQSSFSQIRSESQPREARVSFGADKPRDPADHIEYPSVPIQEKNQYYFSHSQETQVPNNKPRGHVILPSVPKSQFNFSQTHFKVRPQETQASSNVNKSRDRPKASMPTQDQGQGPNASLASASKTDTRPHLLHGTPSQMDTQYVSMLLALDDIPTLYNILAGFFNWILLAGFILFPGTFTSLKNLGGSGQLEQQLVHVITSIPLFVIAWICTGVGATGMLWLWWRWRRNYLWALNQIFMPGALNSLAGFISTMANVYGVQHGELSTASKTTIVVAAASTGVLGILTGIYTFWLVRRIKSQHDRTVGKQRAGKAGEGVVDLSKRNVNV